MTQVKEEEEKVIIIISKPRRRLTHTLFKAKAKEAKGGSSHAQIRALVRAEQ